MNCYVCATTGVDSAAVATCPDCNAGLCLRHVRDAARAANRGGTHIGCSHDIWSASPASAVARHAAT